MGRSTLETFRMISIS